MFFGATLSLINSFILTSVVLIPSILFEYSALCIFAIFNRLVKLSFFVSMYKVCFPLYSCINEIVLIIFVVNNYFASFSRSNFFIIISFQLHIILY